MNFPLYKVFDCNFSQKKYSQRTIQVMWYLTSHTFGPESNSHNFGESNPVAIQISKAFDYRIWAKNFRKQTAIIWFTILPLKSLNSFH